MKTIFEQDGERYQVDIPYHLTERTFENWCDFRQAEAKYLEAENSDVGERATLLEKAISHMVPGDLDQIPPYIPGDDIEQLVEDRYAVKPGDEISHLRLYAHTVTLIQGYQPEQIPQTFRFKFRKKEFEVKSEPAARVLLSRPFLTGEVIETLEYQRRASLHMDDKPLETGNIDYNLGLTEYAILVRQKKERLPAGKAERERFINKRKHLFKDLDLETVMALRFFFINALMRYATTQASGFFGKAPQAATESKRT